MSDHNISTDEARILLVLATSKPMTSSEVNTAARGKGLLPENDGVYDILHRLCRDSYAAKNDHKGTFVLTTKGLRLLRMSQLGRCEEITKTVERDPPEEKLRNRVRHIAREKYTESKPHLSAEVVGIICEVTGIDDVGEAIRELAEDALSRWARLIALERQATLNEEPDEQPVARPWDSLTDSDPSHIQ